MTAPVLYALDVDRKASSRRDIRFSDRFSVSFFVPFKFQVPIPGCSPPESHLHSIQSTTWELPHDLWQTAVRPLANCRMTLAELPHDPRRTVVRPQLTGLQLTLERDGGCGRGTSVRAALGG
jgi:hypothetical protein